MGAVKHGYRMRSGVADLHGRSEIVMEMLEWPCKLTFSLTTSYLATNTPWLATWQRSPSNCHLWMLRTSKSWPSSLAPRLACSPKCWMSKARTSSTTAPLSANWTTLMPSNVRNGGHYRCELSFSDLTFVWPGLPTGLTPVPRLARTVGTSDGIAASSKGVKGVTNSLIIMQRTRECAA